MLLYYGTTETAPELAVAVVALLAAAHGRDAIRERWPDRFPWQSEEAPQDALRECYASGEIGLAEYERELDLLLDDDNERIKAELVEIDGVGDATATEVALAFRSLGHLKRADRADLLAVDDVGPKRADDILSSVRERL